ncbi:PilZ domain-containing protein [Bradyrhizobium sp. McL0616]|uniref:PilZ domain-containing protein n=1 Tax=Bradyrhizobium sp. McL0616 TaxID=3415674 RepID=UPI003CF808AC
MIERRASIRSEINRLALLQVDGVRGVHPCKVENINDRGAKLQAATFHIAAFEFNLSLDGFNTTKRCHVVWRNGNTCGVEFVEPRPAAPLS